MQVKDGEPPHRGRRLKVKGGEIKRRRLRLGLTHDELAAKAKISRSHLANIEEDRRGASIHVIAALAAALAAAVEDVLEDAA